MARGHIFSHQKKLVYHFAACLDCKAGSWNNSCGLERTIQRNVRPGIFGGRTERTEFGSVGYRYGKNTELTEVSGTGIEKISTF